MFIILLNFHFHLCKNLFRSINIQNRVKAFSKNQRYFIPTLQIINKTNKVIKLSFPICPIRF